MTILPFPLWPLAEHIEFGQNTFDGSIGSGVLFCISTSCQRPLIFSTPPPLHRLVGFYPRDALAGFKRFPIWMWRNTDVLDFIEWLRTHNTSLPPDTRKTGFY